MADLSDFTLAACTGIAVLSFYRPKEWERFYRRTLLGIAALAAVAWTIAGAIPPGGKAANEWREALFWLGTACAGIMAWTIFLHWLTED